MGVIPGKKNCELATSGSVNDAGVVVGYCYNPVDVFLTSVPFRWENGVRQLLPLLRNWPSAFANGINNNNHIFGLATKHIAANVVVETPVIWIDGNITNLGIPTGYVTAAVADMNNHEQLVGNAANSTGFQPFLWHDGQISQLPLPSGAINGNARGINDQGEIVGFADFGDNPPPGTGEIHSIRWTPNGSGYDISDMEGFDGFSTSSAFRIDSQNHIVGFSDSATDNIHGYLWAGGPLQDLGIFPGGNYSFAFFSNSAGDIVGGGDRADGNQVAALWRNGVMYDLNQLVPAGTPLMFLVGGINARGQIVVDANLPDAFNSERAYLLTPID